MRNAAIVLVILMLGLCGWWLRSITAVPDAMPGSAKGTVPVVETAAAVSEPVVNAPIVDEPRRSAVATDEVPTAPDVVRVRVVDGATNEPVPMAEVVWYDQSFDWTKLTDADRLLQARDLDQLMRQRGHTVVADAEGRVGLRPDGWASMFARSGTRYGSAVWRPDVPLETAPPFAGEFLLRLRTDRTLVVRAVEEQGRIVSDVTVQLERTHPRPDGTTSKSLQDLPPTGADGLTRLRHAHESFPAGITIVAATLRARISGADGPPTVIDPAALPDTPVDVLVPAFGSVLVELLGPDGRSWALPPTSDLSVTLASPTWTGGTLDATNSERLDTEGRATFARVRCGLRFKLRGPMGWDEGGEFDGPRHPGDCVRMTLRMVADVMLVAGRVLREDATPFVGVAQMQFEGGRGSATQQLALDGEGRFCVPVPKHVGASPAITVWQQANRGAARREAEVALRGPLVPGRNDLGDVLLREPPLLVSGQVVFAGGVDLTGVLNRVGVEIERCPSGEREFWLQANELGVRLDAERRFEVRAHAHGQRFRLVVRGDCAPQPPREFVPGTKDLRLEVSAGGSVTATLLVDPLWERLTYRLVSAAPDAPPTRDWRQQSHERGHPHVDGERIRVHWHGLAAGARRVLIGCPGLDPLVDLVVDVPAGGPANDPRLLDIDLRGRARSLRVLVTDAAGKRFAGKATIALRGRPDEGAQWHGQPFDEHSGESELLLVTQPVDLFVVAAFHRGVLVSGVYADTTVALLAAPQITLQWRDAPILPEGVTSLLRWTVPGWPAKGPSLTVSRGSSTQTDGASRMLGLGTLPIRLTDGRATFAWEPPFPVQLELWLYQKGKPSQLVAQPGVIDPAQLVDGQTIELRADPAVVQAALLKLGAK